MGVSQGVLGRTGSRRAIEDERPRMRMEQLGRILKSPWSRSVGLVGFLDRAGEQICSVMRYGLLH
jgi:hypothetical protein